MLDVAAAGLYRRYVGADPDDAAWLQQLPSWAWLVFLADLALFVPIFFWLAYTLCNLYPALALVEDSSPPPTYEALPSDDSAPKPPSYSPEPRGGDRDAPVTSSLLRTHRHLAAASGGAIQGSFRGLGIHILAGLACIPGLMLAPAVPVPFGDVITDAIALPLGLPLTTAWVHRVATRGSSSCAALRRIPGYARSLRLLWRPLLAVWAARAAGILVLFLVARAAGLPTQPPPPGQQGGFEDWISDASTASCAASAVVLLAALAWELAVVLPTWALLVRAQAGLFPVDPAVEPIVPLDPALFGGDDKGRFRVGEEGDAGHAVETPATVLGTWRAVPRATWMRFYAVVAKSWAVSAAFWLLLVPAVVVPEAWLIISAMSKGQHDGGSP